MKKLSRDQRLAHVLLLKKIERKRAKKTFKLERAENKSRFQERQNVVENEGERPREPNRSRDNRVIVKAPETLCLVETRQETLNFLRLLRQFGLREKHEIRLDLSDTKKVSSSAMLLFYALIDSILIDSSSSRPIAMAYPSEKKIEQICQQIGLLSRVGISHRLEPSEFPHEVSRWKVAYGHLLEAKELHEFISAILVEANSAMVNRYNKGLKEAIGNCIEHAYIHSKGVKQPDQLSKWWMFGGIVDGQVVFVVCDLGLGIPRTLHVTNDMKEVRSRLRLLDRKLDFQSDKGKIEVACNLGKSRFGKNQGRGKGLAQLIDLMNSGGQESVLSIYSNKGSVLFSGASKSPHKYGLNQSVMGTILEWGCPIENFDIDKLKVEVGS